MPPLPFQIDRSSRLSLTRQLVDGFRRAIAEGRYAEGGLLPSLAEITRLETDPMKDGDKIGRIILRILAGGAALSSPVLTSVFKAGETFPATGN